MLYYLVYAFMFVFDALYLRCRIEGRDNIPNDTGYIIASNHLSNWDPFIIGWSVRNPIFYMAKEELFRNKLVGWFISDLGAFPIRRDTADFKGLREALRKLGNKRAILMFPEGTRGRSQRTKKPQQGVGFLATKAQVPVIPIYVEGTGNIFPKKGPIHIKIGKPIKFDEQKSFAEISSQVVEMIYALQ